MLKPSFRAALVATTLALVLVPAGAASAQSVAVDDASGDTWKSSVNINTGEEGPAEPAGSTLNTDLVRTVVKHTGRALKIKATYTDLKRVEYRFGFMARVRTNEGLKREIGVETYSRRGWSGTAFVTKPAGREVSCRGISHEIDYTANTVVVSVPRSCLSSPRWVQATVGGFSISESNMGEEFDVYVDNGHNESSDEPHTWTKRLRKG